MKISLEWLHEYLPGKLDATVAGEALTNGGLPVEVTEKHGDDTVIDVEVTSNRGDCLSHVGVARELAALLGRQFKDVEPIAAEATTPASSVTSVAIEALHLCPHYTARVIRNVKIKASPAWMQRRLEAVGLRPINNVVDVTNYVMFEMGQPLHAFDFDRLSGKRIVVRGAMQGETLVSIDGHERKLMPDMLVIADDRRAVALAGVMGGRDSEVSEATANVLLESARFDPLSVRTTSRRLALKSDSSYRFERGIDPTLPLRASLRAAQLILETAAGELLQGVVQAGAEPAATKSISLRPARMKQVLGVEVPGTSVIDALQRLQLRPVMRDNERIDVTVPTWRADLNIEADLIEEVARVVGYDNIPVRDEISIRLAPEQAQLKTIETIRQTLVACGYFEAITVTFVSDALADDFKPAGAVLPRADAAVRKADARLRPSLLPGLLESIRHNEAAGNGGVQLFESGSAFTADATGKIEETVRLALIGPESLADVRGAIELLLSRLDATRRVGVVPATHPGFAADAGGRIEWGQGRTVGFLGKIDRPLCAKLDLRSLPAAAELELAPLLLGAQHVPQLRPLPRYPAVRRDLSFVISDTTRFDELHRLIDTVQPANLEEVEFVGVYRGKPLQKGTKSVTVSLLFRAPTQTLTSESVDASVKALVQAALVKGWSLRE
jgi:phenylalanyl-tRNA synthetase beta chain